MSYYQEVKEATDYLQGKLGKLSPRVGVVLGSGLGAVANRVTEVGAHSVWRDSAFSASRRSRDIRDGLWRGGWAACRCWSCRGACTTTRAIRRPQVTFPMRVLGLLGIDAVILTNAAGGIDEGYELGQLVALSDHINMMGWNPLMGPNEPRFATRKNAGLRFFDMTEAYSQRLRALAKQAAHDEGISTRRGRLPGYAGAEL